MSTIQRRMHTAKNAPPGNMDNRKDGTIAFAGRRSIRGKASMHLSVASLVTLCGIFLHSWHIGAQDDSAPEHLKLIEDSVKKIAAELNAIYSTTCASNPQDCSICSHDKCAPLPAHFSTTCLQNTISDLQNCDEYYEFGSNVNSTCSSITVLTNKTSVSFARTDSAQPTPLQTSTICRTQAMEKTFVDLSTRTKIYTYYYAGTIDGSQRAYPGKVEISEDCRQYDSRRRPWYSGGISYPNYLVIVIDCGNGMRSSSVRVGSGKLTLDDAKDMASQLLGTLYDEDYVNVITFGADSEDIYNTSVMVNLNFSAPETHPELTGLRNKISSLTPAQGPTTVDKFVKGLNTTLDAFGDAKLDINNPPRLQNVVLFTDGSFTSTSNFNDVSNDPSVDALLSRFTSEGVRLFIYGINTGETHQQLQNLADKVNGVYENVTVFENPLFLMRSYFGYLASVHQSLYGDQPFWGEDYLDFWGGVGDIVTVALPAFTGDGRFVGVAAIDVILAELPPSIHTDFVAEVSQLRVQQRDKMGKASGMRNISSPVPQTLDDSPCPYNVAGGTVLCQSTALASGADLKSQQCCNACGGETGSRKGNKVAIIVGSVIGSLVLVAVLAITACICCPNLRTAMLPRGRPAGLVANAAPTSNGHETFFTRPV